MNRARPFGPIVAASLIALGRAQGQRAEHDMSGMTHEANLPALPLGLPLSRVGSGTGWVPDASPEVAAHGAAGKWMIMLHGAAFGVYDRQATVHGDVQLGLTDWEMLMAARPLAGGLLRLEAMTSLQPLVDGPRGYPELLQTGGAYEGARIADRQHSSELVMALAAGYDHSLTSKLATSLYVAAAGEPALGPVAYMHRPSAREDPFAPLGHHWQDPSHESFGVITGGLYTRAVKLEGSVFNGRDPDGYHLNLDYSGARLDSYSGRVTVAPASAVSVSAWGGYLFDHDRLEPGLGMQRYGASVLTAGDAVSTAVVWGLNIHHHGARDHNHDANASPKTYHVSSSVLLESTVDLSPRVAVYGRLEQVQKTADDLGFLGGDAMQLFTIRAVSLGATRDVLRRAGACVGVGARGTVNLVPATLRPTYQTTTPLGVAVFLRVRPERMRAQPGTPDP